ncbi:MAG TPA: cation diffusion facilitator family transporter [Spirochaetota bacterium]|nr:cation diffusion facilitator family transporter [Spirochaetota bacterium]
MKHSSECGHDHSHEHSHVAGKNIHHHAHGDFASGGRLLLVIVFNMVITAAEYIGGIFSGSLALISDAGHNFSDVLSLCIGYAGEKISAKKRSGLYTFGYKRFEVLAALINSLTLILIGLYIFYESIERFRNPQPVDFSIMLPVAVIGLLGNIFSILVLQSGVHHNLNVKAAFMHLFFDAVSSVAVIIAAIIIHFTSNYWVDIVISFFIAVMIIWSAIGILRESLRIFLQGVPGHLDSDDIYNEIIKVDGVESLHGLHVWSINSREVFLSCHIRMDESHPEISDLVIQGVNNMLKEKFGIEHTALQVEMGDFCGDHTGGCCN